MKKESPILFTTEMVKAILDDRKTMTSRVVKFPKGWVQQDDAWDWVALQDFHPKFKGPYGSPGDLLYVKETYAIEGHTTKYYVYKANFDGPVDWNWKPSIFMPKVAARIWLEVMDVKVTRLQDMNRGDCMSEGCPFPNMADGPSPLYWFAELWESLNGHGSWHENPWCWRISFKRVKR